MALCAISCVWAGMVLYGQSVRFSTRDLIDTISAGKPVDQTELNAAISDYQAALALTPCNTALHKDALLLLAQKTDATFDEDIEATDRNLEATQAMLGVYLSCKPRDGKAWLDFAIVNTYREGFTPRAVNAYEMSARVAPGESWLSEKRILFALQFRPLLSPQAQATAENDLHVLERAHPLRLKILRETAQVDSNETLYALFEPAVK